MNTLAEEMARVETHPSDPLRHVRMASPGHIHVEEAHDAHDALGVNHRQRYGLVAVSRVFSDADGFGTW